MNRYHELLDVDRITAEMYGVILKGRENQLPLLKNEIEHLDELEEEIDSVLDMVDYEFFFPSKEKFWEDNLL
jgi:hypothetical protein